MQTRSLHVSLATCVALAALAGCGGKTATAPAPSNAEQTAVTTSVVAAPDLLTDGLMDGSASTAVSLQRARANSFAVEAAITPRYFWRTILSAVPHFTFAFSDTDSTGRPLQADVMVSRRILGSFNILKASANDPSLLDSANVVHKPFEDNWVRFLRLRRRVLSHDDDAWRIVAASGVKVTSSNGSTSITSIRVQSTGRDTTITDPLGLYQAIHYFQFAPGDSIELTATTSRTDDVVLAYWHDHRERFHSNGDGTYTYTLHLGDVTGFYHFGVNALSNGTLYDDVQHYDSMAWILHCVVGPPPSHPYYE